MKTRSMFFDFMAVFFVLCCNTSLGKACKTPADINELPSASHVYVDKSVIGFPDITETPGSSFQLVTHGRPGQLLIEGQWMHAAEIAAFIAPAIYNTAIHIDHLNIYGCEFGKGAAGKNAVAYLEKTLGIAVSASDDITGKDGDWELETGSYVSVKGMESYSGNLQYAPGDDFDNDGTINSIDLDDDNDGAPDAVESPACFYNANEWNTLAKPTQNGITITSELATSVSNFSQLLDNVPGTTAVTFNGGQAVQNKNVYLFTFAKAVRLNALYLKFNTATQFAGTTKIQGSNTNNGTDWVDLSAAISQSATTNTTVNGAVTVTTSIKYPVTINAATGYKYIRITGVAVSNTAAQNASEVYFDFNPLVYVASFYPKTGCVDANIDGDGILPQFDLDSDGDGGSDAFESGASTNTAVNYQFPDTDANNDGLADAVDADGNGMVNYASTYKQYAANAGMNATWDSDGDGIRDIIDIDDDNDGIPDVAEQADAPCLTTNCNSWITPFFTGTSAPKEIVVDGEAITYTITTSSTFNPSVSSSWSTLQCGLGTVSGFDNWQLVQSTNETVTFNFSKPVTNMQFVLSAIEEGESVKITTNNTQGRQTICASCKKSGTTIVDAQNTIVNGDGSDAEIFRIGGAMYTAVTIKANTLPANFYMTYGICGLKTYLESPADIDTDGDGTPNRLDLNSDGDGCPDLREAGVSPLTDLHTPSSTNNEGESYGITNPAGSQLNPAGIDVNNDGLNDSVDPDSDGVPNYSSTYFPVALEAGFNACADFDNDLIKDLKDIDDDNDGVLDATESPSCFYTFSAFKNLAIVTSDLSFSSAAHPLSSAVDGNTTTWAAIDDGYVTNKTLIEFKLPIANPISLSNVTVQLGGGSTFSTTSSFRLEGWNGSAWEALSAAQPMSSASTTYTFTNTLLASNPYNRFRIRGLTGSGTSGTRLQEVSFNLGAAYNASTQPKPACATAADSDGNPNHRDLDSDGDGCSDALEGGATTSMTADYQFAATPDANANGLNDTKENGTTGTINYASTYEPTATSATLAACVDTDGDSINDITDIDDDNDGVLDAIESPSCFYTETEAKTIISVTTDLSPYSPPTYQIAYSYDNNTATWSAFNYQQDWVGKTIFEITPATALAISSVNFDLDTWYISNGATSTFKLQGWDGSIWIDLSMPMANTSTTDFSINNSLHQTTAYFKYRVVGVAGTSYFAGVREITLTANHYIPSAHPKSTCVSDTDNDGIFNHLDLDSDGDKCPDAYEAGTYNKPGVTANNGLVRNGSGGAVASEVSTSNAEIAGPYSSNGFADVLQATADTNSYKYTYTYSIAADPTQKACCVASNTAPVLTKTADAACAGAYDLNSVVSSTAPAYNALQWYTDNLHTNLYATPAAAGAGTYYAFYKDTINNCFSPASAAFTLTAQPAPAGSASPQTICSGNTTDIALNSTIGGTTYTWVATLQSGSVTGFGNCASACGNTIAQTLSGAGVVSYAVTPTANGCTGNAFTVDVTVAAPLASTITYSGSPYQSGSGTADVTQTGQTGGTYSAAPPGLSIDAATGQVNINNSFADTYTVKYVFSSGTCTDSVTATLVIVPTNDTITATAGCPTCPVTVCAVTDDVDTTGDATYSTPCGTPPGYTASSISADGCITYTPDGTVTDTAEACIVTCNNGKCDTTRVILNVPVTPDTVTVRPNCPTCPVVACVVADDIVTDSSTTYSSCGLDSADASMGSYEIDLHGCLIWHGNGNQNAGNTVSEDTIKTCIVACNGNICDTTYVFIAPAIPPFGADTIVIATQAAGVSTPAHCATGDDVPSGYSNEMQTNCGLNGAATSQGVLTTDASGCLIWTPNATQSDTVMTCIVKSADTVINGTTFTVRDTTFVYYLPLPQPDTQYYQASCLSCEITICPTADDISVTSVTSFSNCAIPAGYVQVSGGYSPSGCITIKPDAGNPPADTLSTCIVACNGSICDTTRVILYPPITPDTATTTPACPTCPVTVCAVVDDVDTTGAATYSTPCGTPAGYTASSLSADGCITYTPDGMVTDTAEACIVTCNNGRCDTTRVILYPPVPTNDTATTTPACPTCPVTLCAVVDDVDTTGGATYSTPCGTPAGYTASTVSADGCITYTPNGMVTDTAQACIVTCNSGRCDTTRVILYPPVPTNDTATTTPACPTCPVTVCAVVDDVDTTGGASYSTPCGTPAGYTASAVSADGCITYTPNGMVTDTAQACIVTCNNGRCDTTRVILYPPVPTNDTATTTPACPTCPVTVCAVVDDVDTTGGATYSTPCGTPAGYTASAVSADGCITYTPNGTVTDTAQACIVTCNSGRCDTTRVILYPPVPTNDTATTTPACPTCPVTVCAVVDDVDTTGGATYSTPCGTPAGYTASSLSADGCITYTPDGMVTDTAEACIVTCNNGRCDTTRVILYPPVPTNDTATTTPACPTCPVTVCAVVDDVDTTGGASYSTPCGTPAGYTASAVSADGCITYTPNGTVTDTAQTCIVTCNNGRCDTTRVILYPPVQTMNHDWNVGFTQMQISGSVATNDQVYANTTYSGLQAHPNNPTAQQPMLNVDGTYTFTAAQPGNYTFVISVCAEGQATGCPTRLLWINVIDTMPNGNALPVANPDMVTTTYQSSIAVPTLDNDASGNYGGSLNPASVTVTNMPGHGTIDSIGVNGAIYYRPDAGFTGTDTLVYSVCDQMLPSNCDTAYQIIRVLPPDAANTTAASDDYAITLANTPVSNNVKGNDLDPEGNNLSVTPATTSDTNGTFTINDQGSYTFTPANGFAGTAPYSYKVCDDGAPAACAIATVYILVYPSNTTPLPVKVISFSGKALDDKRNLLTWKVTDAKDMDRYEIIRSTDQKAWTSLGYIAAENKDGMQSMQLVDNNPDVEDFYKLILHGQHGRSEAYPKVIHIRRSKGAEEWARLYPNPAATMVNVEYYSLEKNATILVDLMDVTGRKIKTSRHLLAAGSNMIHINISGITDGIYYIRYTNTGNGRQESMKFIKETK